MNNETKEFSVELSTHQPRFIYGEAKNEFPVLELNIHLDNGLTVVLTKDNMIEFNEEIQISLGELKTIIEESEKFIEYKKSRKL